MWVCPECQREFTGGERFCPFDGGMLTREGPPSTEADRDVFIGQVLDDRYKIESRIGKGGMGVVYKAHHVGTGRDVAIKVLRSQAANDAASVERFRREALTASKIGDPHLVDILDTGTTHTKQPYLVMELLEGRDLGAEIRAVGALPLIDAASVVLQCCEALESAHSAGIVHRDLKPENIFLVPREDALPWIEVLDFGLAKILDGSFGGKGHKLTKTGMVFGTPKYMSPEQCKGDTIDPRSDVYAMGLIAYEALTGGPTFDGTSFLEVVSQHLNDAPKPPSERRADLPRQIEAVILKALAKKPEERQDSIRDFRRELKKAYADAGITLPPLHPTDVAPPTTGPMPRGGSMRPLALADTTPSLDGFALPDAANAPQRPSVSTDPEVAVPRASFVPPAATNTLKWLIPVLILSMAVGAALALTFL